MNKHLYIRLCRWREVALVVIEGEKFPNHELEIRVDKWKPQKEEKSLDDAKFKTFILLILFLCTLCVNDPQHWNWPDLRSLCNHRSPACWAELRWLYADTCWSKTHKTTGDDNTKHTQRYPHKNTTSWSSRRTAASHLGDRVEGEVINTRNSAGEATCACVKVLLSFVHSSLVGYDLFSHTNINILQWRISEWNSWATESVMDDRLNLVEARITGNSPDGWEGRAGLLRGVNTWEQRKSVLQVFITHIHHLSMSL